MKRARRLPLFLLIAVFSAVAAQAGVERVFNESFSVQPGGDLVIYTSGGDIEVTRGADDTVTVVAKLVFSGLVSESQVDELMEEIELIIKETEQGFSASFKQPKQSSGWFSWFRSTRASAHFWSPFLLTLTSILAPLVEISRFRT